MIPLQLATAADPRSNPPNLLKCETLQGSEALRGLSKKYLVEKTLGGRAPKFEHCLQNVLSMQPGERAVLTVLLLRVPQSAGEGRRRTDRLHTFESEIAELKAGQTP